MNINNSRNNNNRRRGRGNNNRQGGGGGQQLNRIDSRARGNAPQLLEKYRKLAQDAHMNGDRVQAEYYLQFADHYFRVLADQRQRQEEQRARRDERWEGGAEEGEEASEFTADSDFPTFDQPVYQRRDREDRPREDRQRDDRPRDDRQREDRSRDDRPRFQRSAQEDRVDLEAEEAPRDNREDEAPRSEFEPAENPFVRDNPAGRGLRPRRAPRRDDRSAAREDEPAPAFDASILPPAIAIAAEEAPAEAEAPVKKPRGRPRKVVDAAPAEQD